ncbi:restriction endonuclease subunit S [uncultured Dialister sp.]|uniref:restriction endonuclease subunit S n=1 Tax=uncultured Dialister sp. TaxID=278064 RepID=UPI0025D6EC58|nr:restriction endonuclease subunit S [uncultured Dialister sp.]
MMEERKVPALRFQGFTDGWEENKLGKMTVFSKGSGYSKSDLQDHGTPIVLYGRLYTNYEILISHIDTFVEPKQGAVYSQGVEVIVPASGETAEDISRASVIGRKGVIIGGDLNILYPNKLLDPVFLAITISNGKAHEDMAKRAQGKTVGHLHNDDLAQIKLFYPSISEQKQIGVFFQKIDVDILLLKNKLDKLQVFKKSMLEKMFPRPGEKVPEVRFRGFTGDWEIHELNSYLEPSKEKNTFGNYTKDDVLSVSGDFGVVNQIQFQGRSFAGASVLNYGVVHTDDIIYTKSPLKANPYGIIKTNSGMAGIVSTLYAVYRPKNGVVSKFIECYFDDDYRLNKYLHPLVNKGAKNDMKISSEKALQGEVIFPPSIEEQLTIAQMISAIEKVIMLYQRKLEKLQSMKQAMLSEMFI